MPQAEHAIFHTQTCRAWPWPWLLGTHGVDGEVSLELREAHDAPLPCRLEALEELAEHVRLTAPTATKPQSGESVQVSSLDLLFCSRLNGQRTEEDSGQRTCKSITAETGSTESRPVTLRREKVGRGGARSLAGLDVRVLPRIVALCQVIDGDGAGAGGVELVERLLHQRPSAARQERRSVYS
eukprot:COSAG04_NODE_1540_length_6420_cov_3.248220_6_plen_183_part_00